VGWGQRHPATQTRSGGKQGYENGAAASKGPLLRVRTPGLEKSWRLSGQRRLAWALEGAEIPPAPSQGWWLRTPRPSPEQRAHAEPGAPQLAGPTPRRDRARARGATA
jgi:hypothetical protein